MFNFKKQIRNSLYESRKCVREQDESSEKMAPIDANKMAQSLGTEIDYYVKKLRPLTFDNLPDKDEKDASMRQQEVLAFYEKFKGVISQRIQIAKKQNKELEASDLESNDFRNAVNLSTKLIKASDQATARNKDSAGKSKDNTAKKETSNLSNMLFEPVDPNDSTKGFKSKEHAAGSQASNINIALKGLVTDYSLMQNKPNSKNRKRFMNNLNNLVKSLGNIKIESVDLDNILREFEQRFKK